MRRIKDIAVVAALLSGMVFGVSQAQAGIFSDMGLDKLTNVFSFNAHGKSIVEEVIEDQEQH